MEGYKEDLKPVFKSTTSQFMTIIYSVEYDAKGNEIIAKPEISKEHVVTKQSLSNHQVIVKLSLSIPNIGELLRKMVSPMSAKNMRHFCGQKDSTYFKANVIDPLISEGLVAMTHPNSPKSPTQKYYLTDLGKALLKNETNGIQAEGVSEERVNRLIAEFTEALPQFASGLPVMEEQYHSTLPIGDARCFQSAYKMKKEMFQDNGTWIYETPELLLHFLHVKVMREPPRDAWGTSSSVSFDISYSLNGENTLGKENHHLEL